MRWRNHIYRCVSVEETDSFTFGVPARFEGCEPGFVARGLVISPPCFQLVIPSLHISCAADPDVSSPYGGVSMSVHDDLLLGDTIFSGVRFVQPTA
jgi:hypothetical protein